MPTDTAPHPAPTPSPAPPAADDGPAVTDPTVVDPTVVAPGTEEPGPRRWSDDDPTAATPPTVTPGEHATVVEAPIDGPPRPPWEGDDATGGLPPSGPPPPPPVDPPPGPGSGPAPDRPPVPFARPERRLRRSSDDAYLGGVAGGIARHVGIEPLVVRVVLGVATIASFGMVASLYGAAWLLLPDDLEDEGPGVRWYREHEHDTVSLVLAALGALLVAGMATALWGGVWGDDGDGGWFAGILVVGIAAIAHRRRARGTSRAHRGHGHRSTRGAAGEATDGDDPDPAPGRAPRPVPDPAVLARRRRHRVARNATLLAATSTGATAAVLWGTGAWDVSGWVVPALVLGVLLLGLAASPWVGWSWSLTGAVLVVLPLLVVASIPGVSLRGGIGTRIHTPQTVAELRDRYQLGIGSLEVDLTQLALAPGSTTEVRVGVGMGEAVVRVPATVDVELRGHVSGGTVLVDGEDIDVRGADVEFQRSLPAPDPVEASGRPAGDRAAPLVVVRIEAGFGEVDLRRSR